MQGTKRFFKIQVVLVLVLAALLCSLLGACVPKSPEDAVRSGVDQQFNSLPETLTSSLHNNESLASLGINVEAFVKQWLQEYEYTIDDVVVNADSATANVTVTAKQLSDVLGRWDTKLDRLAVQEFIEDPTKEDFDKEVEALLNEALTDTVATSTTISLFYTYKNNTWQPSGNPQNEIIAAFVGGSK